MWVGAGRIVLDFYNNDNLTVKHRELTKLCKELRRKFNISAAEVAEFDEYEKCVIGFSAVLPANWSERKARDFLKTICKEIDTQAIARISVEECELYYQGPNE